MKNFKFKMLLLWAKLFKRSIVLRGKTSKGKTILSKSLIAKTVSLNMNTFVFTQKKF
jgi:hypothetical protein